MTNSNNYCVIMAGGIGSRFWPYSRKNKPKQFLEFFGTGHTLLQLTYDRYSKIVPPENIFIATNVQYEDLVKEQLPEVATDRILLEPTRRNTAPCIAWASYHIQQMNPDANIIVAPADHLILKEGEFIEVYVKASVEACEKRDPKGLYKKARNNEIQNFTGISAPYEEPLNPEVVLDSENNSIEQCVEQLHHILCEKGLI